MLRNIDEREGDTNRHSITLFFKGKREQKPTWSQGSQGEHKAKRQRAPTCLASHAAGKQALAVVAYTRESLAAYLQHSRCVIIGPAASAIAQRHTHMLVAK